MIDNQMATAYEESPSKEKLPVMSELDREIFTFVCEIKPQWMYGAGLEEYGDRIWVPSFENVERALFRIKELKARCSRKDVVQRKFLESVQTTLELDEPGPDVGCIVDYCVTHLVKEGFNLDRFKELFEQMYNVVDVSLRKREGRQYTNPVKMLTQYQIIGVNEMINLIDSQSTDAVMKEKVSRLRNKVGEYARRFAVEGFTDGEFLEVMRLMKEKGSALGREKFYPKALKYGFDYKESPGELERKALRWIDQELPAFKRVVTSLSKINGCENNPEALTKALNSKPGVRPEEALQATLKIRRAVRRFVAEKVVGMNARYDAEVLETPPYLSPILPTGAAQGFNVFTEHPIQRFYLTTDPKRAPVSGFADLVNLLVHEEYGHCLHYSNTATNYAANASICESMDSLHGGSISEGLSFQREMEFLEALNDLKNKQRNKRVVLLSEAERDYIEMTKEFGGFEQTLLELEFSTYKNRMIRFLRVIGDARINSGKQNLPEFVEWAEKKTGIPRRTVFYQIFPAHEGIFPGYATCYAVIGQDIRAIEKRFIKGAEDMVRFNAYASSMGFPPRSVFIERLSIFARELSIKKKATKPASRRRRKPAKKVSA